MAFSQFLPIHPENSVELGDDCFAQVSLFQGVIRVHIRRFAANAVSYTPTAVGVAYDFVTEWRALAAQFPEWRTTIDASNPKEGALFTSAKTAVIFEIDPSEGKQVRFVLASRKQITLTYSQFINLCEGVNDLEEFHGQIARITLTDAQEY